jgi:hypothetical protein
MASSKVRVKQTVSLRARVHTGVARFFLATTYQNEKKYQWPQNVPNCSKIHQMAVKFTNIFHFVHIRNISKLGFLVPIKIHHLATLVHSNLLKMFVYCNFNPFDKQLTDMVDDKQKNEML